MIRGFIILQCLVAALSFHFRAPGMTNKHWVVGKQHGLVHPQPCSTLLLRMADADSSDEEKPEEIDVKREALMLLDCMTSPKDPEDMQYDVEKDIRRDNLLLSNDYNGLKRELRSRDLRTSGDKLEMITRLLLHIVDPSINFDETSGLGANLQYIDEADLETKKVRRLDAEERRAMEESDQGPDAEDLMVLRRKATIPISGNNVGGGGVGRSRQPDQLVMDGLSRRETEFVPLSISTPPSSDWGAAGTGGAEGRTIRAYVVAGKDVLKTWERSAPAVVLLPNEANWRSRAVRVLADEIAFSSQAVVVVPDIYMGLCCQPPSQTWGLQQSVASTAAASEKLRMLRGDTVGAGAGVEAIGGKDRDSIFGRILASREEWLEAQRGSTVFDDVVSAMHFMRNEFGAQTVSLAGTGFGAGRALEAAVDLSDLGRLAQCAEMEEALGLDVEAYGEAEGGGSADGFATVETVVARVLGDTAAHPAELAKIKAVLDKYRRSFMQPHRELMTFSNQTRLREIEAKNNAFTEMMEQQRAQGAGAGAEAGADELAATPAVQSVADSIKEILGDSEAFKELSNMINELDPTFNPSGDVDPSGDVEPPSEYAGVETQSRELGKEEAIAVEWTQILAAARRADKMKLYCSSASLPLRDLWQLVPRSVLALSPHSFDVQRVGGGLSAASFFAYGGSDALAGGGAAGAMQLHALLQPRMHEVLDYCFRVYETMPAEFALAPATELANKCAQEAIAMGSLWVDAFTAVEQHLLTDGVGDTKANEEECFVVVPDAAMENPVRPSAVADYLHDDPNFWRNKRLD